jgi:hypothetical protein
MVSLVAFDFIKNNLIYKILNIRIKTILSRYIRLWNWALCFLEINKLKLVKFKIVWFIALAAMCVLNSCAIHKEFPFICFASGCVKEQFKVREIRAGIKRMKGEASLRKRKRNKNKPDINHTEASAETKKNTDTVLVENPMKFSLVKQDTLITIQFSAKDEIVNADDQLFLKHYFAKANTSKIIEIFIQEFYDENQTVKTNRANTIKLYLISLGVPKEKLTVKSSKEALKNYVEILVH